MTNVFLWPQWAGQDVICLICHREDLGWLWGKIFCLWEQWNVEIDSLGSHGISLRKDKLDICQECCENTSPSESRGGLVSPLVFLKWGSQPTWRMWKAQREPYKGSVIEKIKIYVNGKGRVMLKERGALCSLKRYKIAQLKRFSFLKYLILKCYSQIQPSSGYTETDQPKTRSDFQKGGEIAAHSISFSLPALCFHDFLQCS